MGSSFNSYYYDQFGNRIENEDASTKTKMQIANESVVAMLDYLNPEDRFGMVLFESKAHLAKPLSEVGQLDMEAIKSHILRLSNTVAPIWKRATKPVQVV